MFKIMDSLLNDYIKYPTVAYGLATGTGLVKLGQVGSGRVKCCAPFFLPSYPPIKMPLISLHIMLAFNEFQNTACYILG